MSLVLKTAIFVLIGAVLLSGACSDQRDDSDRSRGSAQDTEALPDSLAQALELATILGEIPLRPDADPGRWKEARSGAPLGQLSEEERKKLSDLMALPYVQGTVKAPGVSNVTRYNQDLAHNGVNVYTSGHAPEAIVMDMDGKMLHRWRYEISKVWPDVPYTIHSTFWRRTWAYPSGELLAIFEGIGMIKLDRWSRLVWSYKGGCHHEAFVTDDGSIYMLVREAQMIESLDPDKPVIPDAVAVLSPDGRLLKQVSLVECIDNSAYKGLLTPETRKRDILHANSIEVFDGSLAHLSPLFARGNVLTSFLKLDAIAIVDLEGEEVLWAMPTPPQRLWIKQHDPRLLPNGNILVFDNQGQRGKSRVVEFDTRKGRIAWQYAGTTDDQLYSKTCGTSRRLPNGNILITESDNGRALEITRAGQVVWEFYNPYRAGENNELIATLFDLFRVDDDYFPWLTRKNDR
jgi:hypothetical protein